MIGFCKINQNITPGLFHFIISANSYTYTLPIHSGITTPVKEFAQNPAVLELAEIVIVINTLRQNSTVS